MRRGRIAYLPLDIWKHHVKKSEKVKSKIKTEWWLLLQILFAQIIMTEKSPMVKDLGFFHSLTLLTNFSLDWEREIVIFIRERKRRRTGYQLWGALHSICWEQAGKMKRVSLPSQKGAWSASGALQMELPEIILDVKGYKLSPIQMWKKRRISVSLFRRSGKW